MEQEVSILPLRSYSSHSSTEKTDRQMTDSRDSDNTGWVRLPLLHRMVQ